MTIPVDRFRRFDTKDGTVLLAVPAAYVHVNFKFRFEVMLGDIGIVGHQPVVVMLQRLCDYTMDIINQFGAFF